MDSKVVIQINTKTALDALLESDSEMIVKIKEALLQNFAKTYLKPIAQELLRGETERIAKQFTEDVLKGWILSTPFFIWSSTGSKLTDQAKLAIKGQFRNTIMDLVNEEVVRQLDDRHKLITETVSEKLTSAVSMALKNGLASSSGSVATRRYD